jgi:uncharacterized membrane protein
MTQQRKRTGSMILMAALSVLGSSAPAMAQTTYSIIDLGTLPGADSSSARGLNDSGQVVGSVLPAAGEVGFVWTGGVMTSTGKLPNGNYSDATAISPTGVVVGDGDTGNFRPQSWILTAAGPFNFFPNNGGNTHAIGINRAGAICGFYTKSLSGNTSSWKGAIWTVDPKDPRKWRTTDLPNLPGTDPTTASAIPWAFNQAGQAAGWAVNSDIGQHGAFWNNDAAHSIVDLGVFPGDWSSIAWGLNDLGQAVGESHPPFHNRPVLWDNDAAHTPVELPLLPGDTDGTATAVNSLGEILGSSTASDGTSRLVLWQDGVAVELQTVLDPTTGAGWTLSAAAAINNLGQIAGTGVHNGQSRAFLMTPVTP